MYESFTDLLKLKKINYSNWSTLHNFNRIPFQGKGSHPNTNSFNHAQNEEEKYSIKGKNLHIVGIQPPKNKPTHIPLQPNKKVTMRHIQTQTNAFADTTVQKKLKVQPQPLNPQFN